jgi:hypothetical protein
MASSYSDLKIELIGTGDQTGTWGTTTNNNFSVAVGEAITGSADVAFSSSDVTVTLTDSNSAQTARNLRLNLTGTSGGARNLILGSGCQIEKLYLINNGLADAVTVKNTSGSGIAVAAGKSMFVYNNGTNVVDAITHLSSLTLGSALPVLSGGTGAATLTANNVLLGNGTSAVQFVSPSTNGNVLTANGSTWVSSTPAGGGTVIPAGTVMIFGQTAAPTGFTKLTDQDNAALRVVSGTASTGGSQGFTTAFASQTPTGSVSITSVTGTAGATTLSTGQMPSHTHTINGRNTAGGANENASGCGCAIGGGTVTTNSTGGGGSHDHAFSFSSGSGTFSGNAINLAVKYVDVIRATKD